jgi:tryptophan-rich sensory protein
MQVWSTLYVSMGTASYLISRAGGSLVLYSSQLVLNFMWTPTFFGAKRLKLALANISALDATLLATTVQFFRQSSVAGALMVPYCAWSVLATALNTRIMLDNPEQSQDTNNPPWDQSKTTASKAQ